MPRGGGELGGGWLERTMAVVEGIMEVLGDLEEAIESRSSPTALRSRHCLERWLEGTRIKYKNASTIAIKLGALAPHRERLETWLE